jgi:DNA-binding transcriptional regulator YiaG
VSDLRARQAAPRVPYRKRFDKRVRRRREIEWHAKDVGAAETDDLSRWLIAWIWHNQQAKDQTGAVIECARRMGRKDFTRAEAEAVIEEASRTRRHLSADNLARFLGSHTRCVNGWASRQSEASTLASERGRSCANAKTVWRKNGDAANEGPDRKTSRYRELNHGKR